MSGHSKWATIKRKKGAADAKRSNQFAKLLRAVEVAAREGGSGDVKANMTLASAVDKARSFSVPVENIERAIKRGSGDLEGGARYVEVTYEGYGQGGVAVFVETLTDNRNRTSQDIRHAFTRNGGNLGESGSTAWMFARKGSIQVEKTFAMIGHVPSEPARLVRNLLASYGRAESVVFGRQGVDQGVDRIAAGAAEARQAIDSAGEAASV